jgi:hypothetical protein
MPDPTKAEKRWEPEIDLETGLRLSLDYFKKAIFKKVTAK